jgi:carbonic anhydrase
MEMQMDADYALSKLIEGNRRYVEGRTFHPNQDPKRREEVRRGQHPFAVILGCSDSRVPPEILFDQGIGDLFVIRVAGNVAGPEVLGSIEYAAEHLAVPLVVVLGHEKCGAVEAAAKEGVAEGHVRALIEAIRPAVETARSLQGDVLQNAMIENVRSTVALIRHEGPVLSRLVTEGGLRVAGACYELESGRVEFMR